MERKEKPGKDNRESQPQDEPRYIYHDSKDRQLYVGNHYTIIQVRLGLGFPCYHASGDYSLRVPNLTLKRPFPGTVGLVLSSRQAASAPAHVNF